VLGNVRAFLDMIAFSEIGASMLADSDNGYNVIVGSKPGAMDLFTSYADHPRKLKSMMIKGKVVYSTAAGRYQVLERYYDHYSTSLQLPDFGHDSQDKIALQLIRECGALTDIDKGRFQMAAMKCRSRWASLPGAGYGQHENALASLQAAYVRAGGTLA
jgi:muramidase (phage lysozyme)